MPLQRMVVFRLAGAFVTGAFGTREGIDMEQDQNRLMAQIREGMEVVDSRGERVGTVKFVQMGDPQSAEVETAGEDSDIGLLDLLDPDDDEDVTERMLHRGYVRIDASGIFNEDKYVLSDDVASVEGNTVRLKRTRDNIKDPG